MTLLTVCFSKKEKLGKKENLRPLLTQMRKLNSRVTLEHKIVVAPSYLLSFVPKVPVVEGSALVSSGVASPGFSISVQRQAETLHYTAGLHMFLASVAVNILHRHYPGYVPHHNRPKAFWGFQFEGPAWEAMDRGEGAPSDTTPDFVRKLNALVDTFGHRSSASPVFCAPFLDNRMDRYQTLVLANRLGVPIELTSSCTTGWKAECGHCRQCVTRNQALSAYAAVYG